MRGRERARTGLVWSLLARRIFATLQNRLFSGAELTLDGLTLASEGANFDQARTILDSKVGLKEEKAS